MGGTRKIRKRKDINLIRRVAGNISKFRVGKNLSQEELRDKTGIEIARCESGRYDMTLTTIGILAKYLEVNPYKLLM